ncbi:MAG TPA: efflux RND transporter periplasmic adaptor subunit [Thioploca sp.]|nr:efflux RND transporter periplasmic adaptor subunit [Thioploca sp.]
MLKQIIRLAAIGVWCCSTGITYAAESLTYEVRAHDLSPPVTLSGTVIPKKEVTFKAQLQGEVEYLAGEEGDDFSEDTVLVALDDRELRAKKRAAFANLKNAEAAWHRARRQFSHELWSPESSEKAPSGMGLPHLFDQFITTPLSDLLGQSNTGLDRRTRLHSHGTRIEQAESAIWQARSQIDQIDAKLDDTESRAPFDGVIIDKMVEVGDTVTMGQPLLQFAQIGHLQIEVDVPARLVRGLKVDKRVSAKLDVLDERIVVQVAQIFPIADPQRHTVKVKFDISAHTRSDIGIGPGQYAQVDVPDVKAGGRKLLLIPKAAVVQRGSLPAVCVLNNNLRHEVRLVRVGSEINPAVIHDLDPSFGDYVSILSGLEVGDRVVINRASSKTPCG